MNKQDIAHRNTNPNEVAPRMTIPHNEGYFNGWNSQVSTGPAATSDKTESCDVNIDWEIVWMNGLFSNRS